MSKIIRYWLLDEPVKHQIDTYTVKVIKAWAERWGLFQAESWVVNSIEMLDINTIDVSDVSLSGFANDELLSCLMVKDFKVKLLSEISKQNVKLPKSKLLDSVADKALESMMASFISSDSSTIDVNRVDRSVVDLKNLSNIIKVNVSLDNIELTLLITHYFINLILKDFILERDEFSSKSIKNRSESFSDNVISLEVEYGSVDISIEELSSIGVGDVICLDNSTSSPLQVKDKKGNPLFLGYLGLNESSIALKVTI